MPRPKWNGSRVTKALRWLYSRDQGMCWLCTHPVSWAAKSIDHVLPASSHPTLEWEPTNWRLAHLHPAGQPKGCAYQDCQCPGNTGRRNQAWTAPPSRRW